jgi:transcriptional regulator with XRE-family HTH domain
MLVRLRDIRRAKRLTLADVAAACNPPTTAQTIGRLETGMRNMSVDWLNRIAAALNVDASELVSMPDRPDVPVAAVLTATGPESPRHPQTLIPPAPRDGLLGLVVQAATGDYRAGDQLWLDRLDGADIAKGLNRDCLIPLRGGDYAFGRIINISDTAIVLLPHEANARMQNHPLPVWIGAVCQLIRSW